MKTAKTKIKQLKTQHGGWTKESLAKLGVAWPPPKGWKKKLERTNEIQSSNTL